MVSTGRTEAEGGHTHFRIHHRRHVGTWCLARATFLNGVATADTPLQWIPLDNSAHVFRKSQASWVVWRCCTGSSLCTRTSAVSLVRGRVPDSERCESLTLPGLGDLRAQDEGRCSELTRIGETFPLNAPASLVAPVSTSVSTSVCS